MSVTGEVTVSFNQTVFVSQDPSEFINASMSLQIMDPFTKKKEPLNWVVKSLDKDRLTL